MLTMVIEKPRQFTIVRAVPREVVGAFWATSVENRGESATTVIPQKKRKPISAGAEGLAKNKGDTRQHPPDNASAVAATVRAPNRNDRNPPNTQARLPDAIIRNDSSETFSPTVG